MLVICLCQSIALCITLQIASDIMIFGQNSCADDFQALLEYESLQVKNRSLAQVGSRSRFHGPPHGPLVLAHLSTECIKLLHSRFELKYFYSELQNCIIITVFLSAEKVEKKKKCLAQDLNLGFHFSRIFANHLTNCATETFELKDLI